MARRKVAGDRATSWRQDIIITSSGKNIAPANSETALREKTAREENRRIADAVALGDRWPQLVAPITLDREEAPTLATKLGIEPDRVKLALDLQRRRQLATGLGEVALEDRDALERLDSGNVLVERVDRLADHRANTLIRCRVDDEKHAETITRLYEDTGTDRRWLRETKRGAGR